MEDDEHQIKEQTIDMVANNSTTVGQIVKVESKTLNVICTKEQILEDQECSNS